MEVQQLKELIQAVSDSDLTSFKFEEGNLKLHLQKKEEKVIVASETIAATKVEAEAEQKQDKEGKIVTSPLVGTFYAAPSEDADPYVAVGDSVKKGQTLAIVEAMKLMNEIESEYDGIIKEVFVENGESVEYGQPLFRIV